MIYDCFTFNDEFEILKLRFEELYPVVDRFVLVEATRTFMGQPKPARFARNKADFKPWLSKIYNFVVKDMPDGDDPWEREHYQRESLFRFLPFIRPRDSIILSDVDEIPRATSVAQYRPEMGIVSLQMRMFNYYLDCRRFDGETNDWVTWDYCKMFPGALFNAQSIYSLRYSGQYETMPDAGWHFTYMGGHKQMLSKLRSFSHAPEQGAHEMVADFEAGRDPLERDKGQVRPVPLDGSFPAGVLRRQDELRALGYLRPFDIPEPDANVTQKLA